MVTSVSRDTSGSKDRSGDVVEAHVSKVEAEITVRRPLAEVGQAQVRQWLR